MASLDRQTLRHRAELRCIHEINKLAVIHRAKTVKGLAVLPRTCGPKITDGRSRDVPANIDIGLKTKPPNAKLSPIAPVQEFIWVTGFRDKGIPQVRVVELVQAVARSL
jgi:hypothetical protein